MAEMMRFKDTSEIKTPKKLIDQVIGQEEAIEVIRKASVQRRHVLLIGEPGTGKSMLGMALAELLPREKLVDVLAFPNPHDENEPLIRTVPAGQGRTIVAKARAESMASWKGQSIFLLIVAIVSMIMPWWVRAQYKSDVMFAAFFLGGIALLIGVALFLNVGKRMNNKVSSPPKIIVDNFGRKHAPFFDATGAHAGALLGDVLHDPFQSGGLGTPAHERVVAGMIHKAHMGVLFIDEIATLSPQTQQELLTALQEGRFSITGQSERSAGAMVRTEPVPCRFVLVAAGNMETIKHMHPALRSRIRGYGYEVFMRETMPDTPENRNKLAVFVAQEVRKDGRIPHFSREAVKEVIREARKRANRKNHLSLRLRELGGIVRVAGDIAKGEGSSLVEAVHVKKALKYARPLEKQIADQYLERKKSYEVIVTKGSRVGRVNGLAVMGAENSFSGILLPLEAAVTPGGERKEIVATGKLGDIAKEAVTNVSAIIMDYFGDDIRKKYDIYLQFLQTYEGVEGDSASVAIATAIISALKNVPVKQDVAMTGSLSVRGEVLPVGGVSNKVEAAIDAGVKKVIVPRSNLQDIVIDSNKLRKIKVVPVDHIVDVLEEAIDWSKNKSLLRLIKKKKK